MSFADFKLIGINRFPTSLYMWGDNTNGLLGDNRTPSYFSWSKISSGGLHTVAIRSDGTLFAWGRNTEFQIGDTTTVHRSSPVQIGTSSWSQVSAGTSHTIAIRGDSTLWTWGANRYGQLGLGDTANRSSPVQIGTSSWGVISAGGNHNVGIKIDNSVFAWGFNGSGQLADSTISSRSSPVQVGTSGLTDANAYSLNFNGTQYLSIPTTSEFNLTPSQDWTIEAWIYPTKSDAGYDVVFNSNSSGNFFWGIYPNAGGNPYLVVLNGGVGIGTFDLRAQNAVILLNQWQHIALVNYNGTIKQYFNGVSTGTSATAGTYTFGSPMYIGSNAGTQIFSGNMSNFRFVNGTAVYTGDFTPSTTPLTTITNTILLTAQNITVVDNSGSSRSITNVGGITYSFNTPFTSTIATGGFVAVSVSAGKTHTVALTTDNKLYAWGDNTYGELGDSTTINRSSPVQIGTSSWSQVSAGGTHTVGIESDGSLMAWGYNNYGQLGLNTPYSGTYYTQVSEGLTHTLAIRNDGALFVWGRNNLGQLGTSDTVDRSSPVQIGTSSWSYVDAGSSHSVAVRSDGTLFTWGSNDWGQLGNNPDQYNITWSKIVMSSSGTHSLAIKNDGTLWGWGQQGSEGRIGDGTTTNKSSPVQVGSLTTWIDVAAGSAHSMGITNDNVLYTWGSSTFGQLGDGTNVAKTSPIVVGFNYKKVFAGYQTSVAIDNSNYTYIWGDNTNGLIPGGVVGTHRSNVALLNTDATWNSFVVDQHILGIKTDGSLWSWGLGTTGQLGLGDLISRSSPVQVGTSSWSQVSAGLSYSMGITTDNSLYAWGLNSSGQLGLSDAVNRSAPATVGIAGGLSDANAYSTLFNGSNATFLTIPSGAVTTGSTSPIFTVECWVYLNGVGGAILIRPLATNAPYFGLGFNAGTTQLALIGNSGATNGSILSTKKWYHIALTRSATTYNCYVNGVLDITTAVTIMADSSYVIGYGFDGGTISYPLNGYISNFRISNKVVYTGNFTVPTNPLELTQPADTNIASLTTGEVKFLSLNTSASNPTDASTNGYTITVSGTIASSQLTPFTTAILTGSTIATSVITGTAHTLMLDTIGNLYTWGLNNAGQLGDTTVLSRSSPVQVGTDTYNYIFAGISHSTGIRSTDNALFTWGLGTSGQLGDISALSKSSPVQIGTTLANQSSPVQIGNSSYSVVSAGDGHTLGLGNDGILYGWGKNDQGQIGGQLNTLGIGWSKVVIGPTHSLGIRFDGRLYAWGANATGQLGDRTVVAKSSPVLIDSRNMWKDIAVGQGSLYYSMAIRSDGKLFAWGNNSVGQLGWISWRQISVGNGHSLLLRSDGALYTMGTNTAGQLGDATTVNKSSPVLIGTSSWSFINAGVSASAAIDSIGRLFTWGYNNVGQLGIATTANRSSPVQISAGSWSQVAVEDYMLGITTQGSMWAWGNNNVGQLGLGTTVNSKVPKLLDGTTTSYSIGFDGIGDYLTVPANSAFQFTGNFTIEGWMYFNNISSGSPQCLIGMISSITWFDVRWFTTRWQISLNSGSGTDIGSTPAPTNNSWVHVACVRSGGSIKLYINGVSTGTTITNSSTLGFNSVVLGIGADGAVGPSNRLFGYISNLRIIKGQALYTAKFTPSTSPLTTTSQGISTGTVSLLTAQNATIIDNSSNAFTITSVGTPTITQYNPFSVISSTSSTSWSKVAAGTHSLAILSDSTLYAWGQNNYGQLGDSTTINKSSPIQIGTSSWTLISASMTGHSLGIEVDGTLYAWGRNTYGELGLNNEFIDVSSPTQIGTNSYTSISAGYNTSLGIVTNNNINTAYGWGYNNYNQLATINPFSWRSVGVGSGIQANTGINFGKLYTWGNNTYGQLGNNTTISRSSPTQVGGSSAASTYKFIVNTPLNTAFIGNDNSMYMMGDNTYGQLGQGDTISRSSPVQVGSAGAWSTIAISGTGHALAISSSGTLFAWGRNDYNELGQADNVLANRSSPVIIGTSGDWASVSVGDNYSIAVNVLGAMYTWGRNDFGQLGYSNPLSYTTIGAGIVSRNDGKLYTWGNNLYGQLGNNTGGSIATYRSAPIQIDTVAYTSTSWTNVSGSYNNRGGIKIDGKLFIWGDNRYGQLGVSEGPEITPSRSQPVQILGSWTQVYINTDNIFGIRSDNTLWAWGNNNIGQLGDSTTVNKSSPIQIGTNSNWSRIVASATGHVLGLTSTGQLFAWGNNQYNELGQNQRIQLNYSSPVQVGSSSYTTIGVGNNNSFAIRSDGGLFGWGRNEYGQIGTSNNIPLSWTSVAGGDSYSVAIRSDGKLFSWGLNNKGQLGLGHTVSKSAPTQIAVSTNYNLYSTFFNGTTDYLTVTNNAAFALGSGDFTVECWFYTNTITAAQNHIFDTRTTATGSTNPNLYMVNATMQWLINGTSILTGTIALTTWTHIAVVKRSGIITMYINGVSTSSVADSVTYTSAQFLLGKAWDANYCNGYISNFRMVKGTAVYTGNFAVPTTPLTNITNTSLLTCQNDRFIDNGTANTGGTPFTLTPSGTGISTTTLTPFQTTTYNYSWTQVSATLSHTVAIRNDGTLWAWGANNIGQLGQGDTITRSAPIQIGTITDNSWTIVSAGVDNSFAIRSDSGLFAWGDNTNGILGQDNTVSSSSPLQIGTSSWTTISARQHILATLSTGAMYAWGLNNAGQLGLTNINAGGDTVNRSSPVQIGSSSWNLVSAGGSFSMATLSTGVLFTWGLDNAGQLGGAGTGATTASARISRSSPSQIGASSWSAIASGGSWAGGISAFRLFTWGAGANGETGGSSTVAITSTRSSPVQIGAAGSSFTTISAGLLNGQAITIAGTLWSWGVNTVGQVGDVSTVNRSAPVPIASLTGQVFDNVSRPTQIGTSSWTQVAAGDLFTNALRAVDGGLFTWGYGVNGRLGSGATASRSSPVQVGTSSWIAISTGGTENTVALTTAYTLFSWGRNNTGQVGDATTVDKSAPAAISSLSLIKTDIIKTVTQLGTSSWTLVSAGDTHVLAIKSDTTLWSWGKNDVGQLGASSVVSRSSPVQVGAGTWSVISAGNSASAGITTTGSLQTTGLNSSGQQGAATVTNRSAFTAVGTSSWTNVKALASSMVGTTISNITFIWGNNNSGQLGLLDTVNRSSPVQLGSTLAGSMYQTIYPSPVIVNTATTASWTQIGLGDSFSVGIENSGRLYAWGRNNTGQMGDGTTIDTMPTKSNPTQIATTTSSFTFINTSSPVQISAGTSWNSVTAGGTHTVAIRSDGTLWAWGVNTYGQVGTISTLNQYIPKQIDILNSYTSVAAGNDFSVAINQDSTLWRWGFNSSTDLASPHRSNPLQVGGTQYNKISAGNNTALAITTTGLLYGWGRITTDDNFNFNLAINPISWGIGKSYVNVNAGDSFIHAIDDSYGLWGYGINTIGQLGDNTTVTRSSPVQIGSLYRWSILGSGTGATPIHAGALYLTGLNSSGQLGLGDTANRSSPVQVPANNQSTFTFPVRIGISRWSQVSAGGSHSMAIRDDNTLWGWGLNTSGQVGDTSIVLRSSPVQVGTSSWIAISAGGSHTGGVKLDNTLWMWGLNTRGQIGDSTTTNRSSPVQVAGYWNNVSAGASHTTALADNNTLYVWGDDNYGQ